MKKKRISLQLVSICVCIIFVLSGCQQQTAFQKILKSAESICFIGDSVTAGSNNEGHPWFEPLIDLTDAEITNYSWGGATTYTLLEKISEITQTQAEYYVIAIGTNDIRFRNEENSAMTAEEYIANLDSLVEAVVEINDDAEFVFITPWYSIESDPVSVLSYGKKIEMNQEYSEALSNWCIENNYLLIDPQPYIMEKIESGESNYYLLDYIHPNKEQGIRMYAEAVFEYKE